MEAIHTDRAVRYDGSSQAIVHGDTVYVEGVTGDGVPPAAGERAGGDIREHVARAFENVEAILDAAGTSLSNAVKTTVYLDDKDDFEAMNEVYREYVPEPYPARRAFKVDLRSPVEIEVVASHSGEKREVRTDDALRYEHPASQAIVHGDRVYVGGIVGIPPHRTREEPRNPAKESRWDRIPGVNMTVGGVRDQTAVALENIEAILSAAGTSLDDALKATVYLDDMDDFEAMNEVYREYVPDPYPARRAFEIADLFTAVEIETIVALDGEKEEIRTDRAIEYDLPMSQAIAHGDTVYVSGMIGVPPHRVGAEGRSPAKASRWDDIPGVDMTVGGVRDQTAVALENVEAILSAAGTSLDDAVKTEVYLDDPDDFEAMNEVYKGYFSEPYPARNCLGANLSKAVEIEVIAER